VTQLDALQILLCQFRIAATVIGIDYDPAGSTTESIPAQHDLNLLQPFFDAPLTEGDCYFSVGCGPTRDSYRLKSATIARARLGAE